MSEEQAVAWLFSGEADALTAVEVRRVLRERFGVDVDAPSAASLRKWIVAIASSEPPKKPPKTACAADDGPEELGERRSLVRMIQWVDSQIEGIQRSSMPEASRGALNAFLQVREKLSATNRQTR